MSVGVGACGGGDNAPTSASDAAAVPAQTQVEAPARADDERVRKEYERRRQAEAPTSEEAEAKRSATDFYSILEAEEASDDLDRTTIDSEAFCELMSDDARAQTIRYARVSSGTAQEWDCESAVELLAIRAKRAGGFESVRRAKVIGVNAEGGRATATVQFADGVATSIPMVKEEGEWKLAANSIPIGQ